MTAGTPSRSRLSRGLVGSELDRPTIIRLKKSPIDRTMPVFWKVARMAEARPRSRAGTEFMIPVVLGAAKAPGRRSIGQEPGDEETGGKREHIDAGPQRGVLERVAVRRQPDALQPDDQHELQTAPRDA